MKGLIFNLLDSMARQSGCADEAWDLVMEFVASETDHEANSDTCLSCFEESDALLAFEAPADAMIQCLGADVSSSPETFSEFPELALAEAEERFGDSIPALLDSEFGFSQTSMECPEGFSHDLLSLLEQLLAETLADDVDDEELDEHQLLALSPSRRTSS